MSKYSVWFNFLKITLASPKLFKTWGTHFTNTKQCIDGQITTAELLNPITLFPVSNGLFCDTIFGLSTPFKLDNEAASFLKNQTALEYNSVPLYQTRRYRMGYIKLVSPVAHIWYFSGIVSYISLLLNLNFKILEQIIYFSKYLVFSAILSKFCITSLPKNYYDIFTGASGIQFLLKNLNITLELFRFRLLLYLSEIGFLQISKLSILGFSAVFDTRDKILKRIRLLENFSSTKTDPSWMILEYLPVLPPLLRPLLPSNDNKLIVTDLNKLYVNVILANQRLINIDFYNSPVLIRSNERRLLQESVDLLIDNNVTIVSTSSVNNAQLKSLSTTLRGKQGRFRLNLLGKRVDFSGRSVIVVGPFLKLYQCGLPFKMACELFKPFLIRQLLRFNLSYSINEAKLFLKHNKSIIWFLLKLIFKTRLIILNRAPTLHRLGVQGFEPLLTSGNAILLHPLVCNAFNADFDGDQMAVHIPLTCNAQNEVKNLLFTPHNFLSSTTGVPILMPSHDMIMGYYFLSLNQQIIYSSTYHYFNNYKDILKSYEQQQITLQTCIWVKRVKKLNLDNLGNNPFFYSKVNRSEYILTTFGRILLNNCVSSNLYH